MDNLYFDEDCSAEVGLVYSRGAECFVMDDWLRIASSFWLIADLRYRDSCSVAPISSSSYYRIVEVKIILPP